jgi:hypothetical protein
MYRKNRNENLGVSAIRGVLKRIGLVSGGSKIASGAMPHSKLCSGLCSGVNFWNELNFSKL